MGSVQPDRATSRRFAFLLLAFTTSCSILVADRIKGSGIGTVCAADVDCHAGRCDLGVCTKTCTGPTECPELSQCVVNKCVATASMTVRPALKVRVTYSGKKAGILGVALLTTEPPSGPPALTRRIEGPTFPSVVSFENVEPGRYYARAVVDVDPPSAGAPGPEDATTDKGTPIDWEGTDERTFDVAIPL